MRSRPTFLPLTPWVPRAAVRVAPEPNALGPVEVTPPTAWFSDDGSTWTGGWGDLGVGARRREWQRFGVVFRLDVEGAG